MSWKRTSFSLSVLWLACSGAAVSGCDRALRWLDRERGSENAARTHDAAGEMLVEPYPAGRWRLATPFELERSMLWSAHILITHRDAALGVVAFRLPEWKPSWPARERSRREAWQLAEQLAARARSNPQDFARLAREFSEDVATKDLGGSLGGVTADQLCEWPEILDALGAVKFGEVSRVVETDYGFHVLLRKPPPPEQRVSGARLVISYDQAPWLRRFLSYRPIPARTRAQAFELARSLYQRLQKNPEDFEVLVREHSDHRDALRAGDFGEWSTREPTPFPREIEVLAGLEVGAVAAPIDSPFGVELLKRTPERPRTRFSMTAIEQNFGPELPEDDPDSRASVKRQLAALIPSLGPGSARGPADRRFDESVVSWVEGRGDAADEAALRALEFGAFTPEPVERGSSFAIFRRLAPEPEPKLGVSFELPAPEGPELEFWLSRYGRAHWFAEIERRASALPSLAEAVRFRRRELIAFGTRLEQARSLEDVQALVRELKPEAARLLGPDKSTEYLKLLAGYIEERLMRVEPHPGHPVTVDGMPLRRWPAL